MAVTHEVDVDVIESVIVAVHLNGNVTLIVIAPVDSAERRRR